MKCTVCFAPTRGYKCSQCNTIYCSSECQTRDWTKNNHKNTCMFIEGKRKDENNAMDLCKDKKDSFTQDKFKNMDPREIIILDEHCFHLPSIYNWVVNTGELTNPLTRVDFSYEALDLLVTTAKERYPFTITIIQIDGRTYSIPTTSLISVDALLIMAVNINRYSKADTAFQAISMLAADYTSLIIETPDETTTHIPHFMRDHRYEQLYIAYGEKNSTTIYILRKRPPTNAISIIQMYILYARYREWATDGLEDILNRIERNREWEEALHQILRFRDDDIPQLPIQGQYVLNISIRTLVANIYGLLPVIVDQDDTLETLEQNIRARAVPIMPLPDTQMSFIYNGVAYARQTIINQLPGIANNSTIIVYF